MDPLEVHHSRDVQDDAVTHGGGRDALVFGNMLNGAICQ